MKYAAVLLALVAVAAGVSLDGSNFEDCKFLCGVWGEAHCVCGLRVGFASQFTHRYSAISGKGAFIKFQAPW